MLVAQLGRVGWALSLCLSCPVSDVFLKIQETSVILRSNIPSVSFWMQPGLLLSSGWIFASPSLCSCRVMVFAVPWRNPDVQPGFAALASLPVKHNNYSSQFFRGGTASLPGNGDFRMHLTSSPGMGELEGSSLGWSGNENSCQGAEWSAQLPALPPALGHLSSEE